LVYRCRKIKAWMGLPRNAIPTRVSGRLFRGHNENTRQGWRRPQFEDPGAGELGPPRTRACAAGRHRRVVTGTPTGYAKHTGSKDISFAMKSLSHPLHDRALSLGPQACLLEQPRLTAEIRTHHLLRAGDDYTTTHNEKPRPGRSDRGIVESFCRYGGFPSSRLATVAISDSPQRPLQIKPACVDKASALPAPKSSAAI
jgi:hypothetical protein